MYGYWYNTWYMVTWCNGYYPQCLSVHVTFWQMFPLTFPIFGLSDEI